MMDKDKLSWTVGLVRGHCRLKGHLYKIDTLVDLTCIRCKKSDETAYHLLCDFESLAALELNILTGGSLTQGSWCTTPCKHLAKVDK